MNGKKNLLHLAIALLITLSLGFQTGSVNASAPSDVYVSFAGDQSEWLSIVCEQMTEGGCNYFTANEAAMAWAAQKELGITGAGINFEKKIVTLKDGLELWRLELVVFTLLDDGGQTFDVYATVETANGSRLIDRIVVAPGISPE